MIPVAVSVPANSDITIEMTTKTWAFGEVKGAPRLSEWLR